YLSPFDVWTAEVAEDGAGAGVSTSDNSCTVPPITGKTIPFRNLAYSGKNDDTGPTDLSRTREGYVEMIEMGTVTNIDDGSLDAITHDSTGVPPGCGQVNAAWGSSGGASVAYWNVAQGGDPLNDIGAPSGGLFGSGSVINPPQGTIEGYN